ncbi:MAG: SRPBCC family protein [Anaerolineae bacterium]|nr:SRPBCC family protein [Anaerolineae bacterium]CAG0999510.1 hypothetical protein ANRL4_03023 [Anaerolineae bacterium]
MARYQQRFVVNAPLEVVWRIHDDPVTLKALTPPPLRVTILEKDDPLKVGSTLKFRMFLVGPLGVIWQAIYDEFTPYQVGITQCGFVDRALRSPFYAWRHRHTFEALSASQSAITDAVTFELLPGVLGKLVNGLVGLPAVAILFAYRRFKTKRLITQALRSRKY